MDGYNITIEALKNIVTDKPAPITRPLTGGDAGNSFIATKLVQLKNDGSEDDAEEEAGKNAKNAAADAFGGLAANELKKDGVNVEEKTTLENPMKGEHMEMVMSVGGAKIELTKEAHERKKKEEEAKFEQEVKKEIEEKGSPTGF